VVPIQTKSNIPNWVHISLLAALGIALGTWLWVCINSYTLSYWNEVRLAPTFMWWHGVNPYPGPGESPVTTWIYGPVTLLFFTPAVAAADTFDALLFAAWLNLSLTLLPIYALLRVTSKTDAVPVKVWAFMLSLAAWPASHLILGLADNMAVALGLLSLALLSGHESVAPSKRTLWLLAFVGVLALWSKPTELGPVLGQLLWLAMRHGKTIAVGQTLRMAVAGGICGILFITAFGAEGFLYNVFVVPSRIPAADLWGKATSPVYIHSIALYVLLPFGLIIPRWRQWLFTAHPAQAACWFFLLSLPFNIAGFATIGGNINSLHGCVYLLPWLALAAARSRRWLPPALIAFALFLQIQPLLRTLPELGTARQTLASAEKLATLARGQIYFPWNPLVTFYSERRFYHAEDGLLTRSLTGEKISREMLFSGLPASFNFMAYRYHIRASYFDGRLPATHTYYHFNGWTLVSSDGLLPKALIPVTRPEASAH
jgi:hypothetical protein